MFKIQIPYDISDISEVTFLGNFSSARLRNLGSPEIIFVNSSILIHHDYENVYFHTLVNQTGIKLQTKHNITNEYGYIDTISNVQFYNDLIFLSTYDQFHIYDYNAINSEFIQIEMVDLGSNILNFQIFDDIAYIVSYNHEIISLDISNILKPQILDVSKFDLSLNYENFVLMDISDGILFYSYCYSQGVFMVDITDSADIKLIGEYGKKGWFHDFKHYKDVLFIAEGYEGFQIWNLEVFSDGLIFQKLTEILNWASLVSGISLIVLFIVFYLQKKYKSIESIDQTQDNPG